MEAIRYVVDTLLWLLTLAFLLRLLLQLVRADFRDPFADAIVRVTNWLILPLRRVLPPIGKVDTATLVAVLAAAAARTAAAFALRSMDFSDWLLLVRITVMDLVELLLSVYLFALLIYALLSYLAPDRYTPGARLVTRLCEPVLRPVRRLIPPIGQIDFSVLWVSIAIVALLKILH
jgi:YggT family protein